MNNEIREMNNDARHLKVGDAIRVAGINAKVHLSQLKIPENVYGRFGTITQIGDAGVAFKLHVHGEREFHINKARVTEVLTHQDGTPIRVRK